MKKKKHKHLQREDSSVVTRNKEGRFDDKNKFMFLYIFECRCHFHIFFLFFVAIFRVSIDFSAFRRRHLHNSTDAYIPTYTIYTIHTTQ